MLKRETECFAAHYRDGTHDGCQQGVHERVRLAAPGASKKHQETDQHQEEAQVTQDTYMQKGVETMERGSKKGKKLNY